jgi:hypothetical protein
MSRLGKFGLLAVACIASSLTAVAITSGAAGSEDPTLSACVEPGQAGAMHYLEPGQDCASLAIPGGFEVRWDQFGALTEQEAAGLQQRIAREKRRSDTLGDLGEETSLKLQLIQERMNQFLATLSNILKKNSDTQSSIIDNLQ